MAYFEAQTKNSNYSNALAGRQSYCYVKYSGTPNEEKRYVDLTLKLIFVYEYYWDFGFKKENSCSNRGHTGGHLTGGASFKVGGKELLSGEIRATGTGTRELCTKTVRLYYDDDGNIKDNEVYVRLAACVWWINGNQYVDLECILDTTLDKIPSIASAYSAPSYGIDSVTQIGRVGSTSYEVKYHIQNGSNDVSWAKLRLWDGNTLKKEIDCNKSKGASLSKSFTLSYNDGFEDAKSYKVSVRFSDGKNEYETGKLTFYTYKAPTISGVSVSPSIVNSSNQDLKFTMSGINNRKWETLEDEFYAQARCTVSGTNIGNDWTKVGTAGTSSTFTLSGGTLRGFVPKTYDGQTITMNVRRVNSKANWYSSVVTTTFTANYRPKKGVTCANISYRKNTSSGTSVAKNSLVIDDSNFTGIYVSWTFDDTTADAGFTQGYRIRVYTSGGTVYRTFYTTNKSYTILKADIPKMQETKIDITPYYGNDQSSLANSSNAGNYWYYSSPTQCEFVVVASKLKTPSITYPVEGSEWINTKFRVCFTLPDDPDVSSISGTYTYEDIELDVNGKIFRLTSNPAGGTSGAVVAASIFSSSNLTYQRKMIAAPFLNSNFPSATTYRIKVRVKKKHTNTLSNWSDWSATRTFTIVTASFTPNVNDYIYASHYNNAKKLINRVRNTYGVAWANPPADVSKGTQILRSQFPYSNWYDKIVATKNQVNNYGNFDSGRETVKFDYTNAILSNFTAVVEYVTAASNETVTNGTGRDYMRIVYDRCNKLV